MTSGETVVSDALLEAGYSLSQVQSVLRFLRCDQLYVVKLDYQNSEFTKTFFTRAAAQHYIDAETKRLRGLSESYNQKLTALEQNEPTRWQLDVLYEEHTVRYGNYVFEPYALTGVQFLIEEVEKPE